jgi:opacity protein-like surface antigen
MRTLQKTFWMALTVSLMLTGATKSFADLFSDPMSRLYLKVDAGGNITHETDLKEFFGEVTPGSKVKFDPGARVGFAAGYQLCDWFAIEGEVGVMGNEIKSITDATRVDAGFANVPFLINAKIQFPRHFCLSPYIGCGAGGSAAVLDVQRIDLNDNSIRGSDSDVVFAYQAFAGFRHRINDKMGIGAEYRFFGSEAPHWSGESGVGSIRFGHTQTHAFSLVFDLSF